MWDPHEPFDCPPYDHARYADLGYDGDVLLYPEYGRPTCMSDGEIRNTRALYGGNIALVDRWVGQFLDLAERLGLFENTLIVWASDHRYTSVEGATFDGWVGSDRTVEPSTVTDDEWAYLAAPAGMPSELYHLAKDPGQVDNVIEDHSGVTQRMRQDWLDFLQEHGAAESLPSVRISVKITTGSGRKLPRIRSAATLVV